MSLKYEKTALDAHRERNDMAQNPIMLFLKHKEQFRFNVGDILVKEVNFNGNQEPENWQVEKNHIGSPQKFMYVFENELGIGYLKQLRVDGSGLTANLICTANFNPKTTRLKLDPDFVDHMMVGEGEFCYNADYLRRSAFRKEAMKKNSKLLIRTVSVKEVCKWLKSLKVGDEFSLGATLDEMTKTRFKVTRSAKRRKEGGFPAIEACRVRSENPWLVGAHCIFDVNSILRVKLTDKEPFPLKDPLERSTT